MSLARFAVPAAKLRADCDLDQFAFESTEELPCHFEIIGQERAVRALRLALAQASGGYNVYVQGLTGTGRETTVKCITEDLAASPGPLTDKCYVHNFDDAELPHVLYLPAGDGRALRKDMSELVDDLRREIRDTLTSVEFTKRRQRLVEEKEKDGRSLLHALQERLKHHNLVPRIVRFGAITQVEIAALVEGKPRSEDELEMMLARGEISRDAFARIQEARDALASEVQALEKHAGTVARQVREAVQALEFGFAAEIVFPRIEALKRRYGGEKVTRYLDGVRLHIVENLRPFRQPATGGGPMGGLRPLLRGAADPFFVYRVNLLVDNGDVDKMPVLVESHPTYRNLFGAIERSWDPAGQLRTDFTRVTAGSLLRADGGFLVLSLLDLFVDPGLYVALKRTLKSGKLDIHGHDPLAVFSLTSMRPEPIEVHVKVILIGDAAAYRLLYELDPDFKELFKVKADLDNRMPLTSESVQRYAEFIRWISESEGLPPFARDAAARVVEEGARLAGRQKKLSTRFSEVADLLRESVFWARRDGDDLIRREHVERAVVERIERSNLTETKFRELVDDGMVSIDVEGVRAGQVNGLSSYDMGDYVFAAPAKITASVAVGQTGVVDIERDSELSGKLHSKGTLILSGYVRSRFAARTPLSLSASIAFEQSYASVEGDSASSAELYALLSALADVPLRQDIGVTGSVNQKGDVQAVESVNEKIEGFYETCRRRGLTGSQGVLIPRSSLGDLMLRQDVVGAVTRGEFHVYAVEHVEHGVEVLTGLPAGARSKMGEYPDGTLYAKVQSRLKDMSRRVHRFLKETRTNSERNSGGQ